MNVKVVYITKEEFETGVSNGNLYEGFVIGVGYAYVQSLYQMPGNFNGFGNFTNDYPENNRYTGFRIQKIDTSREMVELSMRVHVSGEFSEITIQWGDTLSGLAKELGVSVNDLMRWNNIDNPDRINAGQRLMIDVSIVNPVRLETLVMKKQKITGLNYTPDKNIFSNYSAILAKLRTPADFLSYGSIVPATVGGLKYTPNIRFTNVGGFWRGANGKYYGMSQSLRSSGRGWNLRANSMNLAKNASPFKYFRYGGAVVGGFTIGYSVADFLNKPNWEDGLDVGAGIVGFYYWPVGVAYTGGKLFFKGMLNYTKTMMDSGLVPGRDDLIIWK